MIPSLFHSRSSLLYVLLTLSALVTVICAISLPADKKLSAPFNRDDPPPSFDPEDGKVLYGVGFAIEPLNFCGALFVIVRTFLKWKRGNHNLSMALRLPFYIASTDIILVVIYVINDIYSFSHSRPMSGLPCRVIGGLIFFFVSMNMSLVGLIALSTYLRVCRRKHFDFGRYDWKLLTTVTLFPLGLTLACQSSFGPGLYWCYMDTRDSSAPITIPVISLCMIFGNLAVSLFCYINTVMEVNRIVRDLMNGGSNRRRRDINRIDVKVTRKVVAYVLIFICQWIPAVAYDVGEIIRYDALWSWTICILSINLGGVGNAIQYGINEGWRDGSGKSESAAVQNGSDPLRGTTMLDDTDDIKLSESWKNNVVTSTQSMGIETEYIAGFHVGEQTQAEYEYQHQLPP